MIVPFGKFKGKDTDDVPAWWLIWCLKQDFTEKKFPEFYEYLLDIEEILIKENGRGE